ncbi:MAG: hypothetical protein RL748_2993, partial [Pseudomonadota bacterium]
ITFQVEIFYFADSRQVCLAPNENTATLEAGGVIGLLQSLSAV